MSYQRVEECHLEHVVHDHLLYFFQDALDMKYGPFAFGLDANLNKIHQHNSALLNSAGQAAMLKANFDGKVAFYDFS
eukprot:773871-Ditylum_brightwellii.AAC.1